MAAVAARRIASPAGASAVTIDVVAGSSWPAGSCASRSCGMVAMWVLRAVPRHRSGPAPTRPTGSTTPRSPRRPRPSARPRLDRLAELPTASDAADAADRARTIAAPTATSRTCSTTSTTSPRRARRRGRRDRARVAGGLADLPRRPRGLRRARSSTDPDARLLVTAKGGEQITEYLDPFARDNDMPACSTPTDA